MRISGSEKANDFLKTHSRICTVGVLLFLGEAALGSKTQTEPILQMGLRVVGEKEERGFP